MRIEELRVTPIALADPPLLNAGGLHAPHALRIVVELETDAGVTGLGESPGDLDVLHAFERVQPALRGARVLDLHGMRTLVAATIGADALDARGDRPWDRRSVAHVQSALEVACLDAMGRRFGCRVADLLGGVVREEVPFAGYLFFKYAGAGGSFGFESDPRASGWAAARQAEALDVDGLLAQARSMVDAFGFASLKIKAGVFDPQMETDAAVTLGDAFGAGMPIRIDPNAVWSFETALCQGRRLQGVIEYLEDPVRGQSEMARLRRELNVPLATNMCTTSFEDLPASISLGSEDILLVDHHYWGGLRPSMELVRICDTFGRGISMHSNSHAGISLAAMTHLGAALPTLRYALDTHYPWQEDDVIAGGRLRIENGSVRLPDKPGLGVDLDRDALARAHASYRACGLVRRDDEIEMRKKLPGWRFQATRY
jgi:glucarate dehydratase